MERRTVENEIWDSEDAPNTLIDLIAQLQAALDDVPPEYRHLVVIEEVASYDDDPRGIVAVYRRPETDAEMMARSLKELVQAKARLAAERAREREALAFLKAKYERN